MNAVLLAYIDPVAGSIFIQTVIAGAVGSVLYFRKFLWGVGRRLAGRKHADAVPDHSESPADADGLSSPLRK